MLRFTIGYYDIVDLSNNNYSFIASIQMGNTKIRFDSMRLLKITSKGISFRLLYEDEESFNIETSSTSDIMSYIDSGETNERVFYLNILSSPIFTTISIRNVRRLSKKIVVDMVIRIGDPVNRCGLLFPNETYKIITVGYRSRRCIEYIGLRGVHIGHRAVSLEQGRYIIYFDNFDRALLSVIDNLSKVDGNNSSELEEYIISELKDNSSELEEYGVVIEDLD